MHRAIAVCKTLLSHCSNYRISRILLIVKDMSICDFAILDVLVPGRHKACTDNAITQSYKAPGRLNLHDVGGGISCITGPNMCPRIAIFYIDGTKFVTSDSHRSRY